MYEIIPYMFYPFALLYLGILFRRGTILGNTSLFVLKRFNEDTSGNRKARLSSNALAFIVCIAGSLILLLVIIVAILFRVDIYIIKSIQNIILLISSISAVVARTWFYLVYYKKESANIPAIWPRKRFYTKAAERNNGSELK